MSVILHGEGTRVVVEDADDGSPGVYIEVSNEDEGLASLILEPDDVQAIRDFLTTWLTEHAQTIEAAQ